MRNVLKRMENQFCDFYFLSYGKMVKFSLKNAEILFSFHKMRNILKWIHGFRQVCDF